MARVQLIIPDEDRDRFVHQARREGLSFSAWLRAAAHERLEAAQQAKRFRTIEDLEAFFKACDDLPGPEVEPDWEEHLAVINASKSQGMPST